MPVAFVVTGLPALLIILVILAIFVLGIVSFTRLTARGARKLTHHDAETQAGLPEARR